MRAELCEALVQLSDDPDMVFLTGDLGFMALEPLQARLGPRFINMGVAEQNMVSVAAALAYEGWKVWCYSIASFCFARPFEQIRNDVCLHRLPVKLIGNGGGYGYGVMGPTHHAVDDYGALLVLPHMQVLVPAFAGDVAVALNRAMQASNPTYVRLGRDEAPKDFVVPAYQPWRQLLHGEGVVLVTIGPIAGMVVQTVQSISASQRPEVWLISELPVQVEDIPEALQARLRQATALLIVEEHVAHGGLAQMMIMAFAQIQCLPAKVMTLHAAGLHVGEYGSQMYLRAHSGLDANGIVQALQVLQQDDNV